MDAIDIIMCVGSRDVERLFIHSLQSCLQHFEPLGDVYVVSEMPTVVQELITHSGLVSRRITVLGDTEVLPPEAQCLPGWYRQQVIKVLADTITSTDFIACTGADTIILRRLGWSDLISGGLPIVYFNRYPHTEHHLEYERRRVRNVASLLGVEPIRSLPLGDFIMDLNVFERHRLTGLRSHLRELHGDPGLLSILPRQCDSFEDKVLFGEWSLYAVYLLDVANATNEIRNSASMHLAQVHTPCDLQMFKYNAKVVHFVNKDFDINEIVCRLREHCHA